MVQRIDEQITDATLINTEPKESLDDFMARMEAKRALRAQQGEPEGVECKITATLAQMDANVKALGRRVCGMLAKETGQGGHSIERAMAQVRHDVGRKHA